MKLFDLMKDISYRLAGNLSDDLLSRDLERVTADPWQSDDKTLFVCALFATGDGHNKASTAYGTGCRLFLAERDLPSLPDDAAVLVVEDTKKLLGELSARCYGHPARSLTVFGITGSTGKSTVAHTVTALLRRAGRSAASLTTDGVDVGGTLCPFGSVVPNGADIQAILKKFLDTGVEFAVIEFSAYMLEHQAHVAIPFTALLLTNFDPTHVGNGLYPDPSVYRALKASLFDSDAPFLVFPANFADFSVDADNARRVCFGEGGDLQALNKQPCVEKRGFGTHFELCLKSGEKAFVSLPVPGDNAVQNALAAASLALIAGLSLREIAAVLSDYVPSGRLECVGAYEGRYVYVDAAYTGEDIARALDALSPYTKGRLSVLIGSVGGRARGRRAPLGKEAARHADFVYLTADNPDCEDPVWICEDMIKGIEDRDRCCIISDRKQAIKRAVLEMRPGDTLLLAGKGGEKFQLRQGKKEKFVERAIVAKVLFDV